MEHGQILNHYAPACWNPSNINGQNIQQNGRYTVDDGRAVIKCHLWQAIHAECEPALYPTVTTMQCTKDGESQDFEVHVENDVGYVWLQFLKAGVHNVYIGDFNVTIVVTAPVPPHSGYKQM